MYKLKNLRRPRETYQPPMHSLKNEDCYDGNFVFTGGTAGAQTDNMLWRQWKLTTW